ncbi:MAG: VWA domain-containing protein [Myxococcales bacterium]|nr:VWA domain-containing protein [Myxococcales bacterium]
MSMNIILFCFIALEGLFKKRLLRFRMRPGMLRWRLSCSLQRTASAFRSSGNRRLAFRAPPEPRNGIFKYTLLIVAVFGPIGCAATENSPMSMAQPDGDSWVRVGGGDGNAPALRSETTAAKIDDGSPTDFSVPAPPSTGSGLGLVLSGALNANKFRALVMSGALPGPEDLPMEGWLNEHDSALPPAAPERPVDLHALASIVAEKGEDPEILLQIGFNTAASLQALQPKIDLVIAIDRSASLGQATLASIVSGVLDVADSLPAQSSLAVLAIDTGAEELFAAQPYTGALRSQLAANLTDLKAQGGTDLYVGLDTSIKYFKKIKSAAKQQRILLVTDGAATAGEHGPADFVDLGKKGGISISTIGVGLQANSQLLGNLAKLTQGTYYEAPDLPSLQKAFGQDLMTLLVPVASKLTVTLELPAGWGVRDSFGLPVDQFGTVLLLGKASVAVSGDVMATVDAAAPVDQSGSAADSAVQSPEPTTLLGQLFPSQRNGLVAIRLQPPTTLAVEQALALTLAKAKWSYTLTASGESKQHEKLVDVDGLFAIPDGGWEHYSHPVARRTAAIVRAGEAMKSACALAKNGAKVTASQVLNSAIAFAHRMQDEVDKANVDSAGAIDDALILLAKLASTIAAKS